MTVVLNTLAKHKPVVWKGNRVWWALRRVNPGNPLSHFMKSFGTWSEAIAWAIDPRKDEAGR